MEQKAALSHGFADEVKDDAAKWKERRRQVELELLAWDEHLLRQRGVGPTVSYNSLDAETSSRDTEKLKTFGIPSGQSYYQRKAMKDNQAGGNMLDCLQYNYEKQFTEEALNQ